jgi:hypothetical protein
MKFWRVGVLAAMAFSLAACRSLPGPEEMTDDGLVRVASRASGGVFRRPEAQFAQYRRLILEPPVIAFKSGWRDQHKEVTDNDVKKIRDDASELFREEFERALIKNGPWQFAENPDADVLIIEPRIEDLDIPAPNAGNDPSGTKTYTSGPVKMRVIGELRDAQSGVIVARVDRFDGNEEYGIGLANPQLRDATGIGNSQLREATRVTNLHEMRMSFGKWSRLLRESLDVAKATRPHRSAPEAGGDLKSREPGAKPDEDSN